jgi:hypothetical protein
MPSMERCKKNSEKPFIERGRHGTWEVVEEAEYLMVRAC